MSPSSILCYLWQVGELALNLGHEIRRGVLVPDQLQNLREQTLQLACTKQYGLPWLHGLWVTQTLGHESSRAGPEPCYLRY